MNELNILLEQKIALNNIKYQFDLTYFSELESTQKRIGFGLKCDPLQNPYFTVANDWIYPTWVIEADAEAVELYVDIRGEDDKDGVARRWRYCEWVELVQVLA